jgi:hypothetical protein
MASADFSQFNHTSPYGLAFATCETSSGKSDDFHLIYLPHLRYGIRAVLDFDLSCNLVRPKYAYYVVSVRQAKVLL